MEHSFQRQGFPQKTLVSSHPQFIFLTHSKDYSIVIIDHKSTNPKIELRKLPSFYIPNRDTHLKYTSIIRFSACDEFLVYNHPYGENETALWNPWLRQVKWIKNDNKRFNVIGLGYDDSGQEKVYKILGYSSCLRLKKVAIHECASHALRFIDTPYQYWLRREGKHRNIVSLNGNLYWIAENFIRSFDFSRENFKPVCLLPCQKNHNLDELILAVYKGDRLSLLKQCYVTKMIGVWATKKIDTEEVEWTQLMALQTTNLPRLFNKLDRISYFISDKTIFMCCSDDETGVACIYIVREDLCKKFQIDSGIVECCHCVYTPNLISVPLT